MSDRVRPLRPDEVGRALDRARAAFGPHDKMGDFEEDMHRFVLEERLLGLADTETDQVVAHAVVEDVDHWFGGRRVPTLHVNGVAVAPEDRGRGAASTFMRALVRQGAENGLGLSILFPATTSLYRKLGWELSGVYLRWRLPARQAPAIGPAMRRLDAEHDWPAVERCADAARSVGNGPEVPTADRWRRLRDAEFGYVLDGEDGSGELEAYILTDHHRAAGEWQYTLRFRDWAATTPRGLAAVVGFVGRHGTIAAAAMFRAGLPNPLAALLPEQDLEIHSGFDWMARGLDLGAAVGARGFPRDLSGSVTLAVDDEELPGQVGPWRLEISRGEGRLLPADDAQVRLRANGFGPLFTGYQGIGALTLAGLVEGPPEALEWLGAAFAGPVPALLDFF